MLSAQEITIIEEEVNTLDHATLENHKRILIESGNQIAMRIGYLIDSKMKNTPDYRYEEKELHLTVEKLVFLDQRIEVKFGVFFRLKRRLGYMNQFRQFFIEI
jgi:hypothetical protein